MKEKKEFRKRLLAISIPLMLNNVISQLQLLIDKIFLGRLDISRMSAVGNATAPLWTTMSVMFSLSVGAAIIASQAVGADNDKKAKDVIASLFKYTNIFAFVLFVIWFFFAKPIFKVMGVSEEIIDMSVNYVKIYSPALLVMGIGNGISILLQMCEKTKIIAFYGFVRSGINIVLDYVLIFGKLGFDRMEVNGAALATLIAEILGGVVILLYVIISREIRLKPTIKEIIRAKFGLYFESVKLGLPTACEDFAWNGGNVYLIAMLNHISMEAAGIYSIIFGVECIPVAIMAALGNATLTIAGQETGKGNEKGIMQVAKISVCWTFILNAIILVFFLLFPEVILSWFTTDKNVILAATVYLAIVGVDLFPKSLNIIIGSGVKGYGDTKWMLGTQIFGTIYIVGMSTFLVLVLHVGMTALFWLVVSDETIRCTINYYRLRSICNGNVSYKLRNV